MAKVHITLKREATVIPERAQRAAARIRDISGLTGVNETRFARHGILTGEVPIARIECLKDIEDVQAVTVDSVKKAL